MSAVLAALPDLPKLVEPAKTLNGKRIRVPPRVNLGDLTVNNLGTVKKLHNVLFPISYSQHFYDSLLTPAEHPEDYNKLVFYQDLPVGVLVCRLEPVEEEAPKTLSEAASKGKGKDAKEGGDFEGKAYKLYVMTLGVLAPYRRQGLASKLIHHALTAAAASHVAPPRAPFAPAPPKAAAVAKGKGKADEDEAAKKDDKADEKAEPAKPRIESVYLHVQVGNDDARQFWERWGFEVKETVSDYYRKIEPRDAWLLERKIEPTLSS
ncbi:GNAT family N-acetyltransferase [Rhodotorula paludigena]|uniref:GNAT family N-acetyltransferase n=1 Tax=Rhodotorula paludigena TaxID=86838 RepID=UPI003176EB89